MRKEPEIVNCRNTTLLLTNCEVHTRKYLDRSFEVRTEQTEKLRSKYFPVWAKLIGQ